MKPRKVFSMAEALDRYFGRAGIKRRVTQASVINEWKQLVGPQIAGVTRPHTITGDGILFIEVSSAAWMQELQLMEPSIIRQLADRGKRVKRIIWRAA